MELWIFRRMQDVHKALDKVTKAARKRGLIGKNVDPLERPPENGIRKLERHEPLPSPNRGTKQWSFYDEAASGDDQTSLGVVIQPLTGYQIVVEGAQVICRDVIVARTEQAEAGWGVGNAQVGGLPDGYEQQIWWDRTRIIAANDGHDHYRLKMPAPIWIPEGKRFIVGLIGTTTLVDAYSLTTWGRYEPI